MKNLIFILLLFGSTSCLTVSKIQKNCDKFAAVCIIETITETVYRDTTIYVDREVIVELPRDTVTIIDTVVVRNNQAFLPEIHRENGIIAVDASVKWSVINISAYLTDSTILQPVRDTILIEKAIKEEAITNTVVLPPVKYVPKLYKWTLWIVIFQIVGLILYLFLKGKMSVITNLTKRIFAK